MKITQEGNGESDEVLMNQNQSDFKVSLSASTTLDFNGTYTVQMRVGDDWIDHDILDALTDNAVSNIFFPVHAVRMSVLGSTAGSASVNILQGA